MRKWKAVGRSIYYSEHGEFETFRPENHILIPGAGLGGPFVQDNEVLCLHLINGNELGVLTAAKTYRVVEALPGQYTLEDANIDPTGEHCDLMREILW